MLRAIGSIYGLAVDIQDGATPMLYLITTQRRNAIGNDQRWHNAPITKYHIDIDGRWW